jgi:hypothetical protein
VPADFTDFEGEYRWVGVPGAYTETESDPTTVMMSVLTCQPVYLDWTPIGLLHVTGPEIVPSSVYEIQWIGQGNDINQENNYSSPVTVTTARWGDVLIPYNPPSTTVQPDSADISEMIYSFRNAGRNISKPRGLLSGLDAEGNLDLLRALNFADISECVDAFRGKPYPHTGPVPCP